MNLQYKVSGLDWTLVMHEVAHRSNSRKTGVHLSLSSKWEEIYAFSFLLMFPHWDNQKDRCWNWGQQESKELLLRNSPLKTIFKNDHQNALLSLSLRSLLLPAKTSLISNFLQAQRAQTSIPLESHGNVPTFLTFPKPLIWIFNLQHILQQPEVVPSCPGSATMWNKKCSPG